MIKSKYHKTGTYLAYLMSLNAEKSSLVKVRKRKDRIKLLRGAKHGGDSTLLLTWKVERGEKGTHKPRSEGCFKELRMALSWRPAKKWALSLPATKNWILPTTEHERKQNSCPKAFRRKYQHLDFSSVRPMSDLWSVEEWDNTFVLI